MEVREGKDFEGSMLSNFSPSRGQQNARRSHVPFPINVSMSVTLQ